MKLVGRFDATDAPDTSILDKGDMVVLSTGEQLMVIAVGATAYHFKSLNGRGKPMLTVDELLALDAQAY